MRAYYLKDGRINHILYLNAFIGNGIFEFAYKPELRKGFYELCIKKD